MDVAWVGVIGGAVGAAGSLLASIATQFMAGRSARAERREAHEQGVRAQWFDDRRKVYLELVQHASVAHDAATELALRPPADPDRRDDWRGKMSEANRGMYDLYSQVLLFGSKRLHEAAIVYRMAIVDLEQGLLDGDVDYVGFDAKYESLVRIAQKDLGIAPT